MYSLFHKMRAYIWSIVSVCTQSVVSILLLHIFSCSTAMQRNGKRAGREQTSAFSIVPKECQTSGRGAKANLTVKSRKNIFNLAPSRSLLYHHTPPFHSLAPECQSALCYVHNNVHSPVILFHCGYSFEFNL